MARKKAAPSGPPKWIVTFADLMSLLLCFFILIAAFSNQDTKKVNMMAGSMREAFGFQTETRRAGLIEINGFPNRRFNDDPSPVMSQTSENQFQNRGEDRTRMGREANSSDVNRNEAETSRRFATAAATIRQAWQEMPEIRAISRNIMIEETPEGVAISLVDQDNRSMFPDGSRFPVERTRRALELLGPVLARMPNPIRVTGHTTSRRTGLRSDYDNWELSADRANSVRRVLMEAGLRGDRFASVKGKADTKPLFTNDATLAPNARVTILLMEAAPALPPSLRP
jgi:chemotaxis protein MotB